MLLDLLADPNQCVKGIIMVSLAKTPQSVAYGRMHSKIRNGLRRNNLLALFVALTLNG